TYSHIQHPAPNFRSWEICMMPLKCLPFRVYLTLSVAILTAAPLSSQGTPPIRVIEKAGVTTANYPIQIGRPFVPGDIPNFRSEHTAIYSIPRQIFVPGRSA